MLYGPVPFVSSSLIVLFDVSGRGSDPAAGQSSAVWPSAGGVLLCDLNCQTTREGKLACVELQYSSCRVSWTMSRATVARTVAFEIFYERRKHSEGGDWFESGAGRIGGFQKAWRSLQPYRHEHRTFISVFILFSMESSMVKIEIVSLYIIVRRWEGHHWITHLQLDSITPLFIKGNTEGDLIYHRWMLFASFCFASHRSGEQNKQAGSGFFQLHLLTDNERN